MAKKLKNPTSALDFALFGIECERWLKFFNLKDWYVYYQHEFLTEGVSASCDADPDNRVASFSLSTEQPLPQNDYEIKLCAFHEACELLFWEIRETNRPKEAAKQTHRVIRILENTVFKEYIEKNQPTA